uniref:Putative sulfotransferase n=1 Tax=Ixodes ricinus TaxID=34613 RepID=A0A0K8RNH3_IXORI
MPVLPSYIDVDGLRVAQGFDPECVREALNFKPRAGDIFVVTFPKCGTHWVQQILQVLVHRGESATNYFQFQMQTPFLEFTGTKILDALPPPRLFKTHLSFERQPYHKEAKYVYVARNVKDCCVSFYHHTRGLPGYRFKNGSFDDFFDLFIKGETDFGDYFDHLLSWYAHRNDPNVFFTTFEDLKKDTRGIVLKMARFLGEEYAKMLEDDPEILKQVLDKSSIAYMKQTVDMQPEQVQKLVSENPQLVPQSVRNMLLEEDGSPSSMQFIRKGVVGDWKGHFTPEQIKRMQARIEEKTKGSDVMSLWAEG